MRYMKTIQRYLLLALMIFIGVMFASNIIVFNNRLAAINMHDDLGRNASLLMANLKVIITFITGIALLITSYGIIRNKLKYAIATVCASTLFFLLYIVEVILWASTYPKVIMWFFIMGGLNVLFAIVSYKYWKNRYANS